MSPTVRAAEPGDVDAIAALSRAHRHRLAEWGPLWWPAATGADDLHPRWLDHLVGQGRFRVVDDGGAVAACAAMVPQGPQWFFDDVAVADESRWPELAPLLFAACAERPALTCLGTADTTRRAAFLAAGSTHVSSYWIAVPVPGPFEAVDADAVTGEAPPHTFTAGPIDATGPYSLRVASPGGGLAFGSPSLPAPPIYDPGGTVAIVDRIVGDGVAAASAAAAARGDVRINVVRAAGDDTLAAAGFVRTVDVHRLP